MISRNILTHRDMTENPENAVVESGWRGHLGPGVQTAQQDTAREGQEEGRPQQAHIRTVLHADEMCEL